MRETRRHPLPSTKMTLGGPLCGTFDIGMQMLGSPAVTINLTGLVRDLGRSVKAGTARFTSEMTSVR